MLSIGSGFFALASAFMLYAVNYDTRMLERQVYADQRLREKLRNDIAVLKAERAHLSHPGRIEKFARDLGLRPMSEEQIVKGLPPELMPQDNNVVTGSTKTAPAPVHPNVRDFPKE